MKFVCSSYIYTKEYDEPSAWLHRIRAYSGILEALAGNNKVISIEHINYEGEYEQKGVQYYFRRFSRSGRHLPLKLHRFMKNQNPDAVMIQSLHFPLQVIQLRLMLGKRVKIIVQNHAEKPYTGIKKYLQRVADRYIDAYLFASRDMGLDWIEKGNLADTEKIHEVMEVSSIFYPVDRRLAKQKTGVVDGLVYLWVGRLDENKDPLTAVKAFLQFAIIEPTAKLYMLYQTDELLPQIQQVLDKAANKHAIILTGKIDNDELLYWYNSADFFISCSHYEGSGTAVCEAMSCGCVPVVTNIFSFRMMTDNGDCGILFEAGNEADLLSALMQSRQVDMEQKRQKTLAYYASNLSFEAIARRIAEITDGLIK